MLLALALVPGSGPDHKAPKTGTPEHRVCPDAHSVLANSRETPRQRRFDRAVYTEDGCDKPILMHYEVGRGTDDRPGATILA
jgi:hypothetical protein